MTYYEHDDQGRMIRSSQRSEWTDEDRALMVAYQLYLDSLCPGCGQPRAKAHHSDNDGWYRIAEAVVCHACTVARKHGQDGEVDPVEYLTVVDDRDYQKNPLPAYGSAAARERTCGGRRRR